MLGADEPGAEPAERLRRLAAAYVRRGAARPGLYQLLLESADRLGDDHPAVGTSEAMIGHVPALLIARERAGPHAAPSEPAAERLWVGLHGLVSLRLHRPGHLWVGDLGAEVDRLLGHLP